MRKQAITIFIIIAGIFLPLFTASAEERLAFHDDRKNIGIYLNEWSDLDNFPETPDVLAWFENWYGPNSFNKLFFCAEQKTATPFITWQPQNIPLQEIASGIHDAYIITYFQNITSIAPDMDILIRFAHEMEVRPHYRFSWYSWQGERNPSAYIEAWRHIVTLSRQINPNIKWVWSPNRADQYSDPFYPGDDYVDYVSITLNLKENFSYYSDYSDFQSFYEEIGIREHLEKYGKKIIISEVAYSNPDENAKRDYIQSIFDYYEKDPCITAIIFFNENDGKESMYNITDSAVLMKVFTEGLQKIMSGR